MRTLKTFLVFFLLSFSTSGVSEVIKIELKNFTLPKPESAYDEKLIEDVTKIGWHHVHVQGEGNEPPFAFSLGFYANYKHPEIIVFGLPPKIAQQLLNINAIAVAGAKTKYETYKPYTKIAEGMRVAFIPVAKHYYPQYLGYAGWFYSSVKGDFPVLQMVWPDKQGHLPWEAGYDKSYDKFQPLLDK